MDQQTTIITKFTFSNFCNVKSPQNIFNCPMSGQKLLDQVTLSELKNSSLKKKKKKKKRDLLNIVDRDIHYPCIHLCHHAFSFIQWWSSLLSSISIHFRGFFSVISMMIMLFHAHPSTSQLELSLTELGSGRHLGKLRKFM